MAVVRWAALAVCLFVGFAGPSWADPSEQESHLSPTDRDYELFRLFVDTLDQVERNYVEKVDRRELMEAAIRGLIDQLDPYSNYISPDEISRFRDSIESQFGGIGIQVGMRDGVLTILSPLVGTPAYKAGLHAGDQIIAIAGEPTEGITIDDAVTKLKGEVGTEVTFTVREAYTAEEREVTVKREIVQVETVLGDHREADDSWDWYINDEERIGYVRITSFSRETPQELRRALEEMKADGGIGGLVLDLRFNPGGLLGAAVEICDMFVKEGVIVSTRGRNVTERTWEAHQAGTYSDFPMVVLINRYSASASEIVSACLQDHDRAVVVGERSWGKGSVQNVIDLEDGKSALKLTTASYWRPSGKNIHRFPGVGEDAEWGVSPDEGYLLKLDNEQMQKLVESRRDRDRVIWTEEQAQAEATGGDPTMIDLAEEDLYVDPQLLKGLDYVSGQVAKATPAKADAKTEAEPMAVAK